GVGGRPTDPKGVAAGGQFADEVGQSLVVGVAAGFQAKRGNGVVGGALPVDPEVAGAGIEEGEPGVVDRAGGGGEHRSEQCSPEGVGGDGVEAAVVDHGR